MKLEKEIPKFEVITACSVLEIFEQDEYLDLVHQQNELLKANGYIMDEDYFIHEFKSDWSAYNHCYVTQIDEAMEECLVMKEGCDLVKFANGNIGFVGYYGDKRSAFEIVDEIIYE